MFKFNELKSIHLEISTRCQASCPMCPRKHHGGVENKNLKIADWSYADFVKVFNAEVYQQLELVYFCGNFGDPILNDDLILMCQHIKDNAPNINVRIHTNGGARNKQWWTDLYSALPKNHVVIFALDGLEDTHHIYRIGTTYDNVVKNAKTFINAGGIAEWVFIKFKHNEHQVEEAELRSKKLKFSRFTLKSTTRFIADTPYNVVNSEGETQYYLEPATSDKIKFVSKQVIMNHKEILTNSTIDCYVLDTKEIYIDAHKHVFPCCFLASAPYNYQSNNVPSNDLDRMIDKFHDTSLDQYYNLVESLGGIDQLSAVNFPIKEIINRDNWQTVWKEYWNEKKLYTCARVCGKMADNFSKPKDQFIKRVTND
jgi:MoaA/NifB/PqqE/SkfB family radical SAM enzyme